MGAPANEVHLCGDGSGGWSVWADVSRAEGLDALLCHWRCQCQCRHHNLCHVVKCLPPSPPPSPPAAVPLVRKICEDMGESFELNEYERFTTLSVSWRWLPDAGRACWP